MNQPAKPLSIAAPVFDPTTTPFDGDLLNRKELARRLTDYVNRLHAGAVIALDAPWGEGKSWFGRHWAAQLRAEGHQVSFIDAFAQDYVEDPFLLVAAELAELLDDGQGAASTLRKRAAAVMRAVLPVGTKALINVAGRFALGTANLSDEFEKALDAAKDSTADAAEKWVEQKLEDHANEKVSLQHYRNALTKYAEAQDKPVVVVVDELDRCNPRFAVRLVERIKHFFEIPNVVFVVLMNRQQLENAIRGVYGSETDAATYLGKFFHLFFRLPEGRTHEPLTYRHRLIGYISDALSKYGFEQTSHTEAFAQDLAVWSNSESMSLRDIERACAMFAMAPMNGTGILAYIIALKMKRPQSYAGIARNDKQAHRDSAAYLETQLDTTIDGPEWPNSYIGCLRELHMLKTEPGGIPTPFLDRYRNNVLGNHIAMSPDRVFSAVISRIDLIQEP